MDFNSKALPVFQENLLHVIVHNTELNESLLLAMVMLTLLLATSLLTINTSVRVSCYMGRNVTNASSLTTTSGTECGDTNTGNLQLCYR